MSYVTTTTLNENDIWRSTACSSRRHNSHLMAEARHDADDTPQRSWRPLDYGRLYDFRFRDVDQSARRNVWTQIAPFIWNQMGRPERVLDPAGGFGEFVNAVPA